MTGIAQAADVGGLRRSNDRSLDSTNSHFRPVSVIFPRKNRRAWASLHAV